MDKRTRLVYGVLAAVWTLMIAWQVVEHVRVKRGAKVALINRAKDISDTVGVVLKTQRHVITKERLESALSSLVKPDELNAVALLNVDGVKLASAGPPIDLQQQGLLPTGEHWGTRTVALMNLVDLGTNILSEPETMIVVPREELFRNRSGTNRSGPPPGRPPWNPPPPRPADITHTSDGTNLNETVANSGSVSNGLALRPPPPRRRFGRPPWMTDEEYNTLIAKQGVHRFVIVMSTQPMRASTSHDLWLRAIISALASISVVGLGLAWSNLVKSSELEVRLVRAAELNTRLREMSLAAAGLAHETKNPLNIIRGLAQIISKQQDASPEIRKKTQGIIEEADRVTSQVNEFINFSRPRQLKPVAVSLNSAVGEVVRALGPDLEEKQIRLQVQNDLPTIEADEQQLRQALFNLLINAIQAVDRGGEIQVSSSRRNGHQAVLELRDNGPGVPSEHRSDVFKPYFTTNQKGTGLGLAVVQQIILAHGWEIECLPNEPRGAVFQISHLRLATNTPPV
jgi:signal transduction histidine kinase